MTEPIGLETYELLIDMRRFVGKHPCDCIDTPAYIAYKRRLAATYKDPLARMLYEILDEPYLGQVVLKTCDRCSLLERYDAIIEGRE